MAPLKRWRSVHNYECTNSKFKIELDNALHLQTGKSGMKEELKIVHCEATKPYHKLFFHTQIRSPSWVMGSRSNKVMGKTNLWVLSPPQGVHFHLFFGIFLYLQFQTLLRQVSLRLLPTSFEEFPNFYQLPWLLSTFRDRRPDFLRWWNVRRLLWSDFGRFLADWLFRCFVGLSFAAG